MGRRGEAKRSGSRWIEVVGVIIRIVFSVSVLSLSLSSTYADVGPRLALNRANVHPVQPNNGTQLGLGHAHAGREVTGLPEGKKDRPGTCVCVVCVLGNFVRRTGNLEQACRMLTSSVSKTYRDLCTTYFKTYHGTERLSLPNTSNTWYQPASMVATPSLSSNSPGASPRFLPRRVPRAPRHRRGGGGT